MIFDSIRILRAPRVLLFFSDWGKLNCVCLNGQNCGSSPYQDSDALIDKRKFIWISVFSFFFRNPQKKLVNICALFWSYNKVVCWKILKTVDIHIRDLINTVTYLMIIRDICGTRASTVQLIAQFILLSPIALSAGNSLCPSVFVALDSVNNRFCILG